MTTLLRQAVSAREFYIKKVISKEMKQKEAQEIFGDNEEPMQSACSEGIKAIRDTLGKKMTLPWADETVQ